MDIEKTQAAQEASPGPKSGLSARLQPLRDWMGRRLVRSAVILLALLAIVALTEAKARRYGDHIQIALPVLALGCEFANGKALDYVGRYVVMFAGVHGTKRALGDAEINDRPNGGTHGFPSGHTATAAFGASSLVQRCVGGNAFVQSLVIVAAAFTGASRIEASAHDIWQVLVGGLWGIMCDQCFRRGSTSRRRLTALVARVKRLFGGGQAVVETAGAATPPGDPGTESEKRAG